MKNSNCWKDTSEPQKSQLEEVKLSELNWIIMHCKLISAYNFSSKILSGQHYDDWTIWSRNQIY